MSPPRDPRPVGRECARFAARAAGVAALAGATLAVALLTSQGAWAQAARPDAGTLLQQTQPPPPPPPPIAAPPKSLLEAPARPTVEMPEGVTVTPSAFRISGAISFTEAQLLELVRPWVGKKLDLAGLNEAAGAITRCYQASGQFLSYAYLPAQKVADGVIEIAVLEGRVESSQVVSAPDVRLRDEVVNAHIAPVIDLRPLLQVEMERQLLLLNDIPGIVARAAFKPGTSPGAAEAVVSVAEDEPLVFDFGLDNYGAVSSGRWRLGMGMHFRDLSGWGDDSRLRLILSSERRLVSGSLASWVPVGGHGFQFGAALSSLTYELGGAFAALGATGSAQSLMASGRYPIVRMADANLYVQGDLEYKRLADELQLIGQVNPKRASLLRATIEFDARDRLLGGGVTAGSLAALAGRLRLLDGPSAALDAAGLGTAGHYQKADLTLTRQQAIAGRWSAYLRYSGQFSHRNLDSSEKLGLGGPGAVRAYAPGEAMVDDGRIGTIELRYALDYLGGTLAWALFHDRGWGSYSASPLAAAGNAARLSGSGVGLRWGAGEFWVSASLAWRGSHVPTAEGGDPMPRLYFQLVYLP